MNAPRTSTMHESNRIRALLVIWTLASTVWAASDMMRQLPPIAIPLIIWGTTLLVFALVSTSSAMRRSLSSLNLEWAFVVHAVRAPVGLVFLIMGERGMLAPLFVAVAGVGDILAGLGALIALAAWRGVYQRTSWAPLAWWTVLVWNIFGLTDILLVFVTAQQILFFGGGPDAMAGFFIFPMPMIPSLLVPLVLLTHGWVFVRLTRIRTALYSKNPGN